MAEPDESVEIIKKYAPWLSYWISEKDKGQTNAINKGFKRATGEIIAWLNSDDIYMPGTFERVVNAFDKYKNVDFIFYIVCIIDEHNNIIGMFKGRDPHENSVVNLRNFIPQPTAFFKKTIFQKNGYLNEDYNLVMDIDYWRRIFKNHKMMLINDVYASFKNMLHLKQLYIARDFVMKVKNLFSKIMDIYFRLIILRHLLGHG